MSFAGDELDESQITAMDLPLEFKVNIQFLVGPMIHKITIIICHHLCC